MSRASSAPPSVSVVIPARNRETTLPAALDSVARQSVPVQQVIVVDDGSQDATAEVARRHGCTVLTHPASRGSGAARNTGIEAATGTWIAFLDSDDEWLPEHVETFLRHLGDNVLVTTRAMDSLGNRRGYLGTKVARLDSARCFVPEPPVVTSGCFVRRDALLAAGLFGSFPRAQDLDMWARTLEHGSGIALPATTVRYLVTEAGMSEESRQKNIAHMRDVAASFRDRPWADAGFYRAIETRINWDSFRRGTSNRSWATARPGLWWLVRHPLAWVDVVRLILSRRGLELGPRSSRT